MNYRNTLYNAYAGIDLRSLALFRIAIGFAMVLNAGHYLLYAQTFFADGTGLYLRSEAMSSWASYYWSLLFMSGHPVFIYTFFITYLLCALSLMLGYKTRAMTIILWVLSVSIKTRALQFNSLADTQLAVLLFWGMFLPLGARLSIDAAINKEVPAAGNRYASIAGLAIILNVAYLYTFGALEKTSPVWNTDFNAVYYALSAAEFMTPITPYVLMLGDWLKPLTAFVYYLELYGPILLFLPYPFTDRGRMIMVPLLMLLHIGFALFLSIGIFPWVSLAGLCALLPTLFWDKIIPRIEKLKSRQNISIFYDRDCGFCLKMTLIFRELAGLPNVPTAPAQGDTTAGPILERTNSWVLRSHKGEYLTHWNAVSYLWRRSPVLFPFGVLFMLPGFKQFGHGIYLLIAKYRKQLARITNKIMPFDEGPIYRPGSVTSFVLALLVIAVLVMNLHNAKIISGAWPTWLDRTMRVLALKQEWGMYAPKPPSQSTWIVAEGTLENGALVDLADQAPTPPSHAKPAHGWEQFPEFRWRKFYSRVKWDKQGSRIAAYYCRSWKEAHPDMRLKSVEIFSYKQKTPLPNEPVNSVKGGSVYKKKC